MQRDRLQMGLASACLVLINITCTTCVELINTTKSVLNESVNSLDGRTRVDRLTQFK